MPFSFLRVFRTFPVALAKIDSFNFHANAQKLLSKPLTDLSGRDIFNKIIIQRKFIQYRKIHIF